MVVDSSMVVAALVDSGPDGRWAESLLESEVIVAPHLMLVEATNILRRGVLAGDLTSDAASLAHADLMSLRVDLYPFEPFADRVWALRATVTSYDAWYAAMAEALEVPLATLDRRLSRAPGPQCEFALPPKP